MMISVKFGKREKYTSHFSTVSGIINALTFCLEPAKGPHLNIVTVYSLSSASS